MSKLDRKAARKRCEAATEAPWEVHDSCSWRRIGTPSHDGAILRPTNDRDGHPNLNASNDDLDFMAHARTDLPAALDLLDRIDEVRDDLERRAAACDKLAADAFWDWGGEALRLQDKASTYRQAVELLDAVLEGS